LAASVEIELPALIVADEQTAGRGRGKNSWWSAEGALTLSLLLEAGSFGVTPRGWPKVSLATAVAVCDVVGAASGEQGAGSAALSESLCSIKWPNDVLVDGRKVGGILIESPGGCAPAKDRLVVGVGINVNNSWRDAPPEFGSEGTAICDVTDSRHSLVDVLRAFLCAFERRLIQLASGEPQLYQTWQRRSWLTGQNVTVDVAGRSMTGRCLGIAGDGALLVQTGIAIERIYSGSVRSS
jgi:BirA family biotin operon repressor/biotin-[acetyl-CoA-carboxylase] ligase